MKFASTASSVTHGWFSSILSFITHGSILWRSLGFNQICDLFLPNEITCYVSVLLFSFGGAFFKPTWRNQHNNIMLLWNVMKIRVLFCFYSYYIDFSMTKIVQVSVSIVNLIKCKRLLMVSSCCGFNFSTLNACLIFALGAALLISLPKWHLKGVKWMVQSFRVFWVNFARIDEFWLVYLINANFNVNKRM